MKHVINFDAYTSYNFNEKDDLMTYYYIINLSFYQFFHNHYYIKHECDYMMEVCRVRGYIYLNQIYEHLGIKWNPSNENILLRYSGNKDWKFNFVIEKMVSASGYTVTIDIHE